MGSRLSPTILFCTSGLLSLLAVSCQLGSPGVPCDAAGTGVAVEPGSPCPEGNPFCHMWDGQCWSDEQQGVTFGQAQARCAELQGSLPSISYLRSLFQDCPVTEPEGVCNVSDTCTVSTCENEACAGCGDGGLNVFSGENIFWSSTAVSDLPGEQFVAVYRYGMVTSFSTDQIFSAYCIQSIQ